MKLKTQYSINYDADTLEELKEYVDYRNLQLMKFGFKLRILQYHDEGIVCGYDNEKYGNHYGAIFLYKSARGKGNYIKLLQQSQIAIVTLKECGIEDYLKKIKCNYLCLKHSTAYEIIQNLYNDEITKRSKVPLIYHIDEGGYILDKIGASDIVKDAYYLHPILQSDDSFLENKNKPFFDISTHSIILTMEYRRVANSYLSTDVINKFVGFSCLEVKQMLIADKVQNYKDFMLYHFSKHPRSNDLYIYFHNWFHLLNINIDNFLKSDFSLI